MTKKFFFAFLFATRLTRLVAWLNRNKVTILCYHSVTRLAENPNDPHKLHLPIDAFIDHLDYLQTHYQIISLEDLVKSRRNNLKLPSNAAILTFDDGVRNFLTVVAPMLLQRKIPATSFIVTGDAFTQESSSLNGNWTPEDDDVYLSWSEVRQLAAKGVEFGSHTCSHAPLPDISSADARGELEISLQALQRNLGDGHFPLSYPYGRASENIVRLTQSLGYSCAVTTVLGQNNPDCDLFALRRVVIASDDDLPAFAARVSGLTSWYNRLTRAFVDRPSGEPELTKIPYEPRLAEKQTPHETY